MKKVLKIFIPLLLIVAFYFLGPFEVKSYCFGDVCPQNGGTRVFYRKSYSQEECEKINGVPVVGIGWTTVYVGCSPY